MLMSLQDVEECWRDLTPEEQAANLHPVVPGFYRLGLDLFYFFSVCVRELSIEGQPTFCEIHYRYINLQTQIVQSCNQTWKDTLTMLEPFELDAGTVNAVRGRLAKRLEVVTQEKDDMELALCRLSGEGNGTN